MHGENLRTRVVTQVEIYQEIVTSSPELPAVAQEKEMPQSQSDDEHVVEVTKTEILKAPKRSRIPRDPKVDVERRCEKEWNSQVFREGLGWCHFFLT